MCKATDGCVAYIFAPANCSGKTGPLCWTKGSVGAKSAGSCRNSRVLGAPATAGADIPSKWAAEVSADKTPLVAYPRPQVIFQYYEGRTGKLRFAYSVRR